MTTWHQNDGQKRDVDGQSVGGQLRPVGRQIDETNNTRLTNTQGDMNTCTDNEPKEETWTMVTNIYREKDRQSFIHAAFEDRRDHRIRTYATAGRHMH